MTEINGDCLRLCDDGDNSSTVKNKLTQNKGGVKITESRAQEAEPIFYLFEPHPRPRC